MGYLGALIIGFVVGMFCGVLVIGLFQMISRKDDIYEKLILEQGRKDSSGVSGESADYFDHFNSHCDRRVCSDRRGKLGETGNIDYRLLHHVNGHLGVQKDSGK